MISILVLLKSVLFFMVGCIVMSRHAMLVVCSDFFLRIENQKGYFTYNNSLSGGVYAGFCYVIVTHASLVLSQIVSTYWYRMEQQLWRLVILIAELEGKRYSLLILVLWFNHAIGKLKVRLRIEIQVENCGFAWKDLKPHLLKDVDKDIKNYT